MPNAKVGVLYQNDAYGKNYYAGLRVGLGAKKGNIVDAESYDVTNPSLTQQILALKSKGADTFVVFATPTPTITALVTATKVGWTPTATFINNVSANRLFLLAAAANGANVDGVDLDVLRRELDDAARTSRASSSRRRSSRSTRRPSSRASSGRREHHVRARQPRGRSSMRSSTPARRRRAPA